MSGISGAFHQRDRDHAGRENVGRGQPGDRAEQAGCRDRDFRRTAPVAPHQPQREIVEHLGAAGPQQKLAEEHEGKDDRGSDRQAEAEQRRGIERKVNQKVEERDFPGLELARHQMAEQGVDGEQQDHDHQRVAGGAPQRLDDQHEQDCRDDDRVRRGVDHIEPVDQIGIDDRDICADQKAGGRQHAVIPGKGPPLFAPANREVQKHQTDAQAEHGGKELLGVEHQPHETIEIGRPGQRGQRQNAGEQGTQVPHRRR